MPVSTQVVHLIILGLALVWSGFTVLVHRTSHGGVILIMYVLAFLLFLVGFGVIPLPEVLS